MLYAASAGESDRAASSARTRSARSSISMLWRAKFSTAVAADTRAEAGAAGSTMIRAKAWIAIGA